MNLRHHTPEPKLAVQAGKSLKRLRLASRLSARELSLQIGKRHSFIDDVEAALEPLCLADFVEIVQALGHDPIAVLREIRSNCKSET
jgi:hypothetical protein